MAPSLLPTMPSLVEAVFGLATDLAAGRHALLVGGILAAMVILASVAAPKRTTQRVTQPTIHVQTQQELADTLSKQEAGSKSDARQLRAQAIGTLGEALVTAELEKTGCPFLRNVILEIDGHTVEIDHIIRTPDGIVALEVKTYSGRVTGAERDQYWAHLVAGQTYRFLNPLIQNRMHVKALEQFIADSRVHVSGFVVTAGSARFCSDIAHLIVPLNEIQLTVRAEIRERDAQPNIQQAWKHLQSEALLRESRRRNHVLYIQSRRQASTFL